MPIRKRLMDLDKYINVSGNVKQVNFVQTELEYYKLNGFKFTNEESVEFFQDCVNLFKKAIEAENKFKEELQPTLESSSQEIIEEKVGDVGEAGTVIENEETLTDDLKAEINRII